MSMKINQDYPGFPKPTLDCSKDKMITIQSAKDEVDINKIVARMQKGQSIPTYNEEPFYGDVSEFGGLQDAIIKVQNANELFMQYPAEVRERFENDPINMINFLEDNKNYEEALKLGLVNKRQEIISEPVNPEPVK